MKKPITNHNGNHDDFEEGRRPISVVRDQTFEPLLDSGEAAALLKIHPKTLQKMARNGEITGIQIGRVWRFRASALNRRLEEIAS